MNIRSNLTANFSVNILSSNHQRSFNQVHKFEKIQSLNLYGTNSLWKTEQDNLSINFENMPIKKIGIDIYFISKFFKPENSNIVLNLLPEHPEQNGKAKVKIGSRGSFLLRCFFELLSMTRLERSIVNGFNKLELSFPEKFGFVKITSLTKAP